MNVVKTYGQSPSSRPSWKASLSPVPYHGPLSTSNPWPWTGFVCTLPRTFWGRG